MSKPKVLVIIEDENRGSLLFKHLLKIFKVNYRVYEFRTNIYTLFYKMKEYDFNADIKTVLKEYHPEHKTLLKNDFAYTYLLFDCDAHHSYKDDKRTYEKIVNDNFKLLKEMVKYFNNETDPTVGKLYLDYPMLESYRYCDDCFDCNYKNATVSITEMKNFKRITGKTKLANKHIDRFSKKVLSSIILQNVFKLNSIFKSKWEKPLFKDYLSMSLQRRIINKQLSYKTMHDEIYVLNTSMFIIPDYFGNRNEFYDKRLMEYHI